MTSWRLSQAQRDVEAKHRDLAALDAYLERLDALHAEALSCDGEYRSRLRAISNRLFEVGPRVSTATMRSTRYVTDADLAETRHLEAERARVEQEWHAVREARTTRGTDGVRHWAYCELDPDNVAAKRIAVMRARDSVAAELAQLEDQLSIGQLVQTGQPASEYVAYREKVAALRERLG